MLYIYYTYTTLSYLCQYLSYLAKKTSHKTGRATGPCLNKTGVLRGRGRGVGGQCRDPTLAGPPLTFFRIAIFSAVLGASTSFLINGEMRTQELEKVYDTRRYHRTREASRTGTLHGPVMFFDAHARRTTEPCSCSFSSQNVT